MIDFSNLKAVTIPEGVVTKIVSAGKTLWELVVATYTNQVPISTDTDGSIYNGTGYKDNTRLSSSGGVSGSAQNGSVTTGFIPWYGDTTYLRIKGAEWLNAFTLTGGHYYLNCYDANKKFLSYLSSGEYADGNLGHIVSVTRDANGVDTIKFSETYGTSNAVLQNFRKAAFIRLNAYGKGKDMIVTVNEEIN